MTYERRGANRRMNRGRLGQTAIALAVLAATSTVAGGQPTNSKKERAFDLGSNRHLFIDEFLIANKSNVVLAVNPPQRRELVMIADKPWERGGITNYCNVFFDHIQKEYRLYYVPVTLDTDPIFRLALATSKDGIHWEKPNLGAVEFKGSKQNNIVIEGQREGTVMIDPNAPPERRYAYLTSEPGLRTRLFASPDGVHWTMDEKQISPIHSDSQISSFWDERLRRYVHYPRVACRGRATGRVETETMDEVWPDEIPVVLAADDEDPPGTDLYTNSAQKYALSPNVYLAFPTPYYHYDYAGRSYLNSRTLQAGGKSNDGTIETQLAVSRDGRSWTRYRTPYVPLYRHEELALKICMVFPGMLYHDAHIDQYIGGYAFTHGDTRARARLSGRELGGVFRLRQRIDGFVSADFAYGAGVLVTEPFVFRGNCLALNVNTSASGQGRVALLDADGKPIEGHRIEDCDFINGDYLAKRVTWRGEGDVSALAGRPVRLRFEMRGTKLYSFRFIDAAPGDLKAPGAFFEEIHDPLNVAPKARATASSTHHGGFAAAKAIDCRIGLAHTPIGEPQYEWSSDGEKKGAWLRLEWDEPVKVDTVLLYDRASLIDRIHKATLEFSDGSTAAVPELPDDGRTPVELRFPAREITWLRLKVERASAGSSNTGLAEIVVRRVKE